MVTILRKQCSFIITCHVADAVHAAVQPSGQTAPAEVVRGAPRQAKKEDHPRAHHHDPGSETENVQLSGVEGPQNRIQKVPICF